MLCLRAYLARDARAQLNVDRRFGKELTVTVTDLGTGDPDLFISTKYSRPNGTWPYFTWRAQR